VRAARVLDMLLLLQRRGRLTARELSAALEVSERTVLRDVEALSEAGVPIYASRGSGGGIELLDGFEARLTGFTPAEAETLFLLGQPQIARRLGLGLPARSAANKLSGALPQTLAVRAEGLSDWFVHDSEPWDGELVPAGELARIAGCIRRRRRIELHLADREPDVVEPLGLVLKAGEWHLVTAGLSVIGLASLRATRVTNQPFDPPPGFSLPQFWASFTRMRRGR
jgi:predicted DNA-binding transcriptional regulator YafY